MIPLINLSYLDCSRSVNPSGFCCWFCITCRDEQVKILPLCISSNKLIFIRKSSIWGFSSGWTSLCKLLQMSQLLHLFLLFLFYRHIHSSGRGRVLLLWGNQTISMEFRRDLTWHHFFTGKYCSKAAIILPFDYIVFECSSTWRPNVRFFN